MTSDKHFDKWIGLKTGIHSANRIRSFREGEIWWCAVGENIGAEINGKSKTFARPVFIMKKYNRLSFLGVPLTTKPHQGPQYANFCFHGINEFAALAQIRTFSVARLYKRMGEVDDTDKTYIYEAFKKLHIY